jgi:hypothetical protein
MFIQGKDLSEKCFLSKHFSLSQVFIFGERNFFSDRNWPSKKVPLVGTVCKKMSKKQASFLVEENQSILPLFF